jgi:formylglycine-generating enzyme required for sulfatase activity
MNRKFALLIGTSDYGGDPAFTKMIAPMQDVKSLERVLRSPRVGGFEVKALINRSHHEIKQEIEAFFIEGKEPDDLLLLYLSCHGMKDQEGRLYFAARDTSSRRLLSTGIPATFVSDVMRYSPALNHILLLDCCYSGAFTRDMRVKASTDASVGVIEQFNTRGKGRVVLTSSDALQYSYFVDQGEVAGNAAHSIFTRVLVEGLESGEADVDKDGEISHDDLIRYTTTRVTREAPLQQPTSSAFDVAGRIVIARNPRGPVVQAPKPAKLPSPLARAIRSPLMGVRLGAVVELAQLLGSQDQESVLAARAALEQLVNDDSRRVSEAAQQALQGQTPSIMPAPAPVQPPPTHVVEDLQPESGSEPADEASTEHAVKVESDLGTQANVADVADVVEAPLAPPAAERVPEAPQSPPDESPPDLGAVQRQLVIESPIRLELVRVEVGDYLIGSDPSKDRLASPSEQPQHRVRLSAFYIGRYPVTNVQYLAFAQATGRKFNPSLTRDVHPVANVSWNDAVAFCEWLSQATHRTFRLPTEAEWEAAARGPDGRIYPWGDEFQRDCLNSGEDYIKTTTPVGKYSPKGDSPCGAADMSGNVWEWCADWYNEHEYRLRAGHAVENPIGSMRGDKRVLRGGAYVERRKSVRCACRSMAGPKTVSVYNGFRVASPELKS